MKRFVGALAVVVFLLALAGLASAQNDDPRIGTWKLNLAKSTLDFKAPKSQTRTNERSSDGEIMSKVERVDADGTKSTHSIDVTADGKERASTGLPGGADAAINRRVGNKFIGTATKGGKVLYTVTEVVSEDGKTLTVAMKGSSADGSPMTSVFVYDKE